MDSEDFARIFRASPGVQRPVLLNAVSSARMGQQGRDWCNFRENIILECHRIMTLVTNGTWQDRSAVATICDGVISAISSAQNIQAIQDLSNNYPSLNTTPVQTVFNEVKALTARSNNTDYNPIGMNVRQDIDTKLSNLLSILSTKPASGTQFSPYSADSPKYFSKQAFRYRYLENAMSRDDSYSSRARDNCSTMLMRIYRLLEDPRFEFLFGPTIAEWPNIKESLATFLRDILGLESKSGGVLLNTTEVAEKVLPFYDRQRAGAHYSNVVIIDLSLLSAEVLENVTALLGRLIHEFLQRLSDVDSGISRGEFPVVLVLEEAQNYIHESRRQEEDSISRQVFERIAREGRKYGLGLVVASQRPSEMSKTVLSQCNSFVVHRLQNPEDLRYFKEIVPGIYGQLLEQLPALAPRNALVIGECVQAPVLVEMREAKPVPRSKNPKFYKSWVQDVKIPDVEKVCKKWEGEIDQGSSPDQLAVNGGQITGSPTPEQEG